jgi:hypothetical protein
MDTYTTPAPMYSRGETKNSTTGATEALMPYGTGKIKYSTNAISKR